MIYSMFPSFRNILTVHNTIKSVDKDVRIRIAAYCFNEMSNKLVVIDRR